MRYDEYQQRRRALQDQLETDLELIRAGHRAKLQALEMLWLASAEAGAAVPASPEPQKMPPPETQARMETQPPTEMPVETQPARSRRITSVEEEVEALLPRLPELFDKDDVIRTLGWEPHRATLHRALDQLRIGKQIAIETRSSGRRATRYRKVGGSESRGIIVS